MNDALKNPNAGGPACPGTAALTIRTCFFIASITIVVLTILKRKRAP